LENGFTPLTKIMSRPTTFIYDGGAYQPGNFGQSYPNRPISLREAIAKSDNIYAVSTLLQIGIEKEIEMAKRLGIHTPLKPTPSLALGSYSVTPFEMTQAYATIASGGKQRPLIAITKIVDHDGTVLVDHTKDTEAKEVISPAHAYVLTQLLTSVFEPGGTGHRAKQIFQRPAAGKTGTTDWDGWLVGYTPNLVTTVWVGYDHSKTLPVGEARLSQFIWGSFMQKVAHLYPNRIFTIPENVVSVYIDEETGLLATPYCKHVRKEYFVKGTEPTATCTIHTPPNPPDRSWLEQLFDLFN
jgi:membrane carboxypeptidase/penicillin-binding protein